MRHEPFCTAYADYDVLVRRTDLTKAILDKVY